MLAFLIGHLCGESCLILHQPDSGPCTFMYRLSVPLPGINETLHVPSQLQMDRKRLKCQNLCKSGSLMSSELPFFTWLPTIYYLFNMWDNCPALSVAGAVFSSARYDALHHLIVARSCGKVPPLCWGDGVWSRTNGMYRGCRYIIRHVLFLCCAVHGNSTCL